METKQMMDDPLFRENMFRLQPQYDASGFLRACPLNAQYRILASIFRSENYQQSQKQQDNLPDILYTSSLLAFSTCCGREAAPLSMLRELQKRREKKEEERGRLQMEPQKQEEELVKTNGSTEGVCEEVGARDHSESEFQYKEEGNYYDANSAEEGQDMKEKNGEVITPACEQLQKRYMPGGALSKNEAGAFWCSRDPFEEEGQQRGTLSAALNTERERHMRLVPDESHWVASPFLGAVYTPYHAAKHLELLFPPVDAFLQKSGEIPSIPVSHVTDLCSAEREEEGGAVVMCHTCIHVLASVWHLHVVYVSSSCDACRQYEGEGNESGVMEELPDCPLQSGVLFSIPLHVDTQLQSVFYGGLGRGRLLLEIHVSPPEVTSNPEGGMKVSLVLGIPPNLLFWNVPSSTLLVECYERRVVHHMAKAGAVLEDSVVSEFWNANEIGCCTDVSKPLFSYSTLLLEGDGVNEVVLCDLAYSETSNALLHAKEHKKADRQAAEWEEAFYMSRNMESPRQRYFREEFAVLQKMEVEERAALDSAAMSRHQVDNQQSFHTIAFILLPFLQSYDASFIQLQEDERWQWKCLVENFSEQYKHLITKETRQRLMDQFAFERRLRVVQCSVRLDILLARETAARAQLERDEAVARHEGKLLDCYIALMARRTVEEIPRCLHGVGEGKIARMIPANFDEKRRSAALVDDMAYSEEALVRSKSNSQHRHRNVSTRSSHSPTTEEFMRVVAEDYHGASHPLTHTCLPRWDHHYSRSVPHKLSERAKTGER